MTNSIALGPHCRSYANILPGEALEWENVIENALKLLDSNALESLCLSSPLYSHDGVQVSFDRRGVPFLGHSRGFNNASKPLRLYLHKPCRVLTVTRQWLKLAGRSSAGRVFLNARGVASNFEQIGRWNWPDASPQDRIAAMYFRLIDF